jgi:hypothetical protein
MIGLGYILLFWLYFVIARAVIRVTINWAKRHNKSTVIWGGIAAFSMFNIIFWDLIPVYGVHSYKCTTEGGLTIYKTLDKWKLENPGIAETLIPENSGSIDFENTSRYHLNQRFDWDTTTSQVWDIVYKVEQQIVDTQTGKVLVKRIGFKTSLKNPFISPAPNLRTYKIWLGIKSCGLYGYDKKNKWVINGDSFNDLYEKFEYINGEK